MEGASETEREFTLVARKPRFGLPTACPHCLPVFIYLKLAKIPFRLGFNLTFPDSVGKLLYLKQIRSVKQRLGITKDNAERREAEIYRRAKIVYEALSTMLGEGYFFFGRPSSLDAFFLGHALFTLQALPEASLLRNRFLEHGNLVRYAEKHKSECLEAVSSSSSDMHFPPSSSASAPREGPSHWSSKPKSKPKREKTEEEKTFRKRAKCFLAAQFTAVLLFITIMRRSDDNELDLDDDDGDLDYD
ncbi:mitochondrial outer membrane import complex protein METAXIN isoform X3 [Syzygium oleosum]|uniref:mitochondrial outer membrane import complex protein METAXIN isoform X3 n=1 Tax=Syzygium oleosum TaxID=219896 RepID=UPI0024BB5E7C|nr:mitochondrial outer membrane import complex protein METAXIN isoform X3 [Syzygium oleosum]